jgi:8-oxo-dGTP pyrophosphatase MutT (NUDIX family)
MTPEQKPKQAATVILLRPAVPAGFEVFLTRRPDGMAFLGGMYCFPGGSVRREDCSEGMVRRCHGLTGNDARKIIGAHFAPQQALGLWIAAVRELFEEVGILLAVNEDEEQVTVKSNRKLRLAEKHAALLGKSLNFQAILESEKLRCDAASLAYFSHWQTPLQFSIRFDTRFFIAALPKDQTPLSTSYEVAHSLWLTHDRELQLYNREELPMIFPTFASLRTLADFESLESVLSEFRPNKPV